MKCDLCGKTRQFGHNISHSGRRTQRSWSPNIKKTTLVIEGKPRRVNICARCLRTQYKLAQTT